MKTLLAAALAAFAFSALPAHAQDVGVSISVGDPNFYGRIDIGHAPPPRVIYREPIVVERVVEEEPVYLRVPPGHRKHWNKHCHEYHACGRRVYFVENDWYQNVYVPQYRHEHGDDDGERHHDHDHDHDEGHGHGHGHGHDKHD